MEKSYLQCPYSTKSKLATALAGSIYTEGPFGLIRFPFSVNQIKRNSQGNFNEKEKELVSSEIENLLKKVAIGKVCVKSQEEKQFLSNVFLSKKKDGSNRLSINLKKLNQFVPCNRLKIEILLSVKDILKKSNFTCKLDFKDAYFCIPLSEESRKYARVYWRGNLFQFLCLCFGLAPAPYIFPNFWNYP